jgi:phosphoribosylanthranilate isomerase
MSVVDSQLATGQRGARRVAVKICGLTRPQDATHAEGAGASYLGAILASGPRLLSVRDAISSKLGA